MRRPLAAAAVSVLAGGAVVAHSEPVRPGDAPSSALRPHPGERFVPRPVVSEVSRSAPVVLPPDTTATAETVPAPVRAAGSSSWRELVAELWGAEAAIAFAVAWCESRDDPNAYNPESGATGLFQVLRGSFVPLTNVREAWALYRSRGWEPWDASRSCWAA